MREREERHDRPVLKGKRPATRVVAVEGKLNVPRILMALLTNRVVPHLCTNPRVGHLVAEVALAEACSATGKSFALTAAITACKSSRLFPLTRDELVECAATLIERTLVDLLALDPFA